MPEETLRENKMGTMPENKLLLSMAVPMMISMLVQALYNIVDSIFVSRICEDALTAVSMAFPWQNIVIAIAVGFGVGINALLSRALGQKNAERVNQVAVNGLLLALLSYLLVLVAGLLGIRAYMRTQTDIESIVNYGITYLNICILCSFGVFVEITFERFLQATGRTVYSMITQLAGALTNIILDPILIFGLLGFPKLGIAGAAWATVIGQCVGAVVAVTLNHFKNPEVHLRLRHIRPSGKLMGEITAISIPSIIMSCISSLTCFIMNLILITFSSTAVAVFGVYFKLQSFVFMPVFGLNNGMVPIIAYNYGAQKPERIHKTIRLGMAYAVAIMAVGLLVFQLIPKELLSMFDASDAMLEIGAPALRIMSLAFVFAGVGIASSSACQAFGYSVYSMLISIARQIVVLIPAAYLLSLTGVLRSIWFAFPIAEIVSLFLSLFFLRTTLKKTGMALPKKK
ncbi:MAG: MATE family efflux transporter [Oscillospiraceae bacterium]|nr:MATE family efflux transporter [Oscillospiraceae bacterium]